MQKCIRYSTPNVLCVFFFLTCNNGEGVEKKTLWNYWMTCTAQIMKLWEPFTFFSFQKVLVQKRDYRYLPKKKLILQSFLWCGKWSQECWLGVSKLCPAFSWMQHRDAELTIALNLNLRPKFTEVSPTLQMSSVKTWETGNTFIEVYKLENRRAAIFIYSHFRKFSPLYLGFLFLTHPLLPVKRCLSVEPLVWLWSDYCEHHGTSIAPYIVVMKL